MDFVGQYDVDVIYAEQGFDAYSWSPGPSKRSAWLSTPGSYLLTGSYICGEVVDSVQIAYAPEPILGLPPELPVELGESLRLPAPTGYASYSWSPPYRLDCTTCARPLARPAVDTLYRLEVANVFGCTAEDSLRVRVSPRLRTYVPTAFSPNDDGRNDMLRLYAGPEVAKVVSFEVYGRWGTRCLPLQRRPLRGMGSFPCAGPGGCLLMAGGGGAVGWQASAAEGGG